MGKKRLLHRILQKAIGKGINHITFQNIRKITQKEETTALKKLLGKLVLDKELLNIIIQEENLKKLKTRFEHRIEIIGNKGELLGTTAKTNETPKTIIQQLKDIIIEGEETKKGDYRLSERFKKYNFQQYQQEKEGYVNRAKLTIIFRKGKWKKKTKKKKEKKNK